MARFFDDDTGLDYVFSDETDHPRVEEVILLIKERLAIAKAHVPMIIRARFTREECAQILKAFPQYSKCCKEGFRGVIIDHRRDDDSS